MTKVYEAICAVAAAISKDGIAKDRKNQQQGYSFRGIDDIYDAMSPLLAQHRLCIIPRVVARDVTERSTKNGGALFYTTLTVEFDFVSAEDGSKHTACTVGEAMDSADKSSNKAQSAAYKYACMQVFCIPIEGVPEADNYTHEVEPASVTDAAEKAIRTAPSKEKLKTWLAAAKAKFTEDEYLYLAEVADQREQELNKQPAA